MAGLIAFVGPGRPLAPRTRRSGTARLRDSSAAKVSSCAEATAHGLLERNAVEQAALHIAERSDLELRFEQRWTRRSPTLCPGLGSFMTKEIFLGATLLGGVLHGVLRRSVVL
jgi:hypothetical protein